MAYFYIKALHFISIVSWFAGLFYLVRLFIYHVEANDKPDEARLVLQEQFKLMENRLWRIITTPAMAGTVIFGLWLLYLNPQVLTLWFYIKMLLVLCLVVYHIICGRILHQLKNDIYRWTSYQLRMWNEVATLLLVAIVFIAILKNSVNWIWGVAGFVALGTALMLVVRWYKRSRGHN